MLRSHLANLAVASYTSNRPQNDVGNCLGLCITPYSFYVRWFFKAGSQDMYHLIGALLLEFCVGFYGEFKMLEEAR